MRVSAPPAGRACTSASPRRSRSSTARTPERLGELALHWRMAAVSVDKAKAANYALSAGQRALREPRAGRGRETVRRRCRADRRLSASAERCEALIGLGEAQLQTGDAAYRETLLEAARIASAARGRRARRASGAGEQPRSGLEHFR